MNLENSLRALRVFQVASAKQYLTILGIMASCIELIPFARLHMRPIQIHMLHFWKQTSKDLDYQIPVTRHLNEHLTWWLCRVNTLKGRSLQQWCATKVLTTDASKTGYGAHLENQVFQGQWSRLEKKLHINLLELDAIYKALIHFLPSLKDQKVLVRCDNTTVVQYINKQGGQISEPLLQNLEFISTSHSEQCRTESGPHNRQFECFGRSVIETENSPNRMVSQQSDSTSSIYDLGKTNDRSFRFRTESQDNYVSLLDSEPTSLRNRCIINTMGRVDSVCISSNKAHTKGS